jgi:hypothetical protein
MAKRVTILGDDFAQGLPSDAIVQDLCNTRKALDKMLIEMAASREEMRDLLTEIRDSLVEMTSLMGDGITESEALRGSMSEIRNKIAEDVESRRP